MNRQRTSRSHSRGLSRPHSRASSVAYLPDSAEALVIPDAPISVETAGLLGDTVNSQWDEPGKYSTLAGSTLDGTNSAGGSEEQLPEDEEERLELEERMRRPFYRRPSPWWMSAMVPIASVASTTTIAPRVEVFTKLACQAIKPEITTLAGSGMYWVVPPPSKLCGQDPDVQAAVAKLATLMGVSMGILSCLTTGWWGQLSDRYGRVKILRIASCGLLIADFNFIVVTLAADKLPGGYRLLLVGPTIDGLFGGMSTLIAALHAYISDSTSPEARSRIFSLNLGLLFGGMALGPTLGALIIRATNNLLSVFYLSTGAHLFYTLLNFFIIPESLTRASMKKAWKRREILRVEREEAALELLKDQSNVAKIKGKLWIHFKKSFAFLAPLGVFLPIKRSEGKGWDFSLTALVFSSAFVGLLMGSYQFKFQYAQMAFGWNSETMGYWLSMVSVVRAVYLIIILPLVIKLFTRRTAPVHLPVSPSEPLHPARPAAAENTSPPRSLSRSRPPKHSPSLDLGLARASLAIELISYVGLALAASPLWWTIISMFSAFGGGFSPAMQSVALALYERGPYQGIETGRLFGGLSVIQALSTQIVGPSLFGLTYISTVTTFPKGIFVVAAGAIACALLLLSFVSLSKPPPKVTHDREELAVEPEQESHA